MLSYFEEPVWRRYKYSDQLWERYVASAAGRSYRVQYLPTNIKIRQLVLANPIFRILTHYDSYGLSPVALAALTRQEPWEVVEQIKRENFNYIEYCSGTHLPVVDAWRPSTLKSLEQPAVNYESKIDGLQDYLGQSLDSFLRKRPLRDCSVHFHLNALTHYISPQLRRSLRDTYTLKLTLKESEKHLMSAKEAKELLEVALTPPPPLLSNGKTYTLSFS